MVSLQGCVDWKWLVSAVSTMKSYMQTLRPQSWNWTVLFFSMISMSQALLSKRTRRSIVLFLLIKAKMRSPAQRSKFGYVDLFISLVSSAFSQYSGTRIYK
jgi:hypothetical protein